MTRGFDVAGAALLFDMDGTLVDSTAVVEQVWAEFADRYDADLQEVLRYAHGRLTIDTVRHFLPPGVDAHVAATELDADELERLEGIVEVPGAADLLRALQGAPWAVVTSASRELARRRMAAAGVASPSVIITAEDVPSGKPSPQGYQRAATILGVPPEDCVVFEDAEAGLQAALASGGRPVVVGGHTSPTTEGLPRLIDYAGLQVVRADGRVRLVRP
jgi:sugar-phosphatase